MYILIVIILYTVVTMQTVFTLEINLFFALLMQKWHCMSEYCTNTASCVSYTHVKIGSEVALLDAVYRVGPLSVGVDATNYHFQFYSDGVYAERGCNSHSLNHGMLLVGYGVTYDGVEYWIVKNRYAQKSHHN